MTGDAENKIEQERAAERGDRGKLYEEATVRGGEGPPPRLNHD